MRWAIFPYRWLRSGRSLPSICPTSDVLATPMPSANVKDRFRNCMHTTCDAYACVPRSATRRAYRKKPMRSAICSSIELPPTFTTARAAGRLKRQSSFTDRRRKPISPSCLRTSEMHASTEPTHRPMAVAIAAPLTSHRGKIQMPLIRSQFRNTFTTLLVTFTYSVMRVLPMPRCAAHIAMDSALNGSTAVTMRK